MAQNITLMGASYSAVPAVTLPKTGGGTARFDDASVTTATAADVASGKIFLASNGTITTGTASGGGGGNSLTLLGTTDLGTISTSSTSATDTGKTVVANGASSYDLLVVITSCTKTNSRHWATIGLIELYNSTDATSTASSNISGNKYNYKVSSSGTVQSRCGTTAYGIYPNSCTWSNGKATIVLYMRYNSTSSGTINGDYVTNVYGLKLQNLL